MVIPFLNYVNIGKKFNKIGSAITLKTSYVGGKTENLMTWYSTDGLSFKIARSAKLALWIQFVKKKFISYINLRVNKI